MSTVNEHRYEYQAAQDERTIELAELLSRAVNKDSVNIPLFAKKVTNDHRTLQQLKFVLFWSCIVEWSKAGDYFDARNEATVKLCKKVVEAVGEDQYFPYI